MEEQDLQRTGLWERIKGVLSAAALLLAIVGAVALFGGFALWLWAEELRDTGQWLMDRRRCHPGAGRGLLDGEHS